MSASDLFDEPAGATPIDPDDAAGLIPTWVATRADLNNVEQANISKAITWASSKHAPHTVSALMTDQTMRGVHKRMFGDVWKWAGRYRRHDTNIGAHWPHIQTQVRDLLADVVAQTADPDRLPWSADEVAIRFHHRLAVIHPFPNGNGRHARLVTDLLVAALGRPVFTWGSGDLSEEGESRQAHLKALRRADAREDFEPLVRFARS